MGAKKTDIMFKQITNLNGYEWYLVASLLIFIGFFIIVGILLLTMKKDFIRHMKDLPLEDDGDIQVSNSQES